MVSLWKRRRASSFRSQPGSCPLQGAFQIASPRVPSVSDHLLAAAPDPAPLAVCFQTTTCFAVVAIATPTRCCTVQGRPGQLALASPAGRPPSATERPVIDRSSIGHIGRPAAGCRHVQWPNRRLVNLNLPGDDDGHRRFKLFRLQLQSCRGRTATGSWAGAGIRQPHGHGGARAGFPWLVAPVVLVASASGSSR
jgi:hypothetical protein